MRQEKKLQKKKAYSLRGDRMKKILLVSLFICLQLFIFNDKTYASPGRTDANGGHTCYTNCEKYGLKYGEYHFHNGGSSSGGNNQSDYDAGYKKGYQTAYSHTSKCEDYEWWWEGSQSYGNGFEAGIKAGEVAGDKVCQSITNKKESEEPKETDDGGLGDLGSILDSYKKYEAEVKEEKRQDAIFDRAYQDGSKLLKMDITKSMSNGDIEIYIRGYKEGILTISLEAKKAGYEQAFSKLEEETPDKYFSAMLSGCLDSSQFNKIDNTDVYAALKKLGIDCWKASDSFSDGFNSNKKAKEILKEAKWDGYLFQDKQEFAKGQKIYNEVYSDKRLISTVILSILGLIVVSYGWSFFKKRKNS